MSNGQTGVIAGATDAFIEPARRREPAYGLVTRVLHWLTVAALAAQFTLGYILDAGGNGRGRGRGRGGDSGRGRGRGGELVVFGEDRLLTAHVVVGVAILLLTVLRLYSRHRSSLPPWAEGLSAAERTIAHWTERSLYLLLFVVPLTGLWLVLISEDALGLHVASHIAFFFALAAHLGLILKHQLINRDGLLDRML